MELVQCTLQEKLQAIQLCSYFTGLEDSLLDELAQHTHLLHYESGEAVLWQDDPCTGLYVIQSGHIKLFKLSPHGRELIVNILGPGQTFNDVPVFDMGCNPVNAAALEMSELSMIESTAIRSALSEHPEICHAVVLNLSQNLRQLISIIEELSFYQVTHRLARLISTLPDAQLGGEGKTRLTQNQLAARLGTVREVVARSLRELERGGAIRLRRRQIEVVDSSLLEQWAGMID